MGVDADFSTIRYAQCWEDADILVQALQPAPGKRALSICSAGDNSLALLSRGAEVLAVDLSRPQLACLELRRAGILCLDHAEWLQLLGARAASGGRRTELYRRCRDDVTPPAREFWEENLNLISQGIGAGGKFERYFALFRKRILPLVHSRKTVERLLRGGSPETQRRFYGEHWDTWRWRTMFRVFFSRKVMGAMGRDPSFFRHVQGTVADRILERTKYALTEIDCATNPYLRWILTGSYGEALPFALREENYPALQANIHKLNWQQGSIEDALEQDSGRFDAFNLSDIFEYLTLAETERILEMICERANPGARLAYWNMLAPRSRPERLADRLQSLKSLAENLFAEDKAFFYSRFIVEERL